ncbi:hypothetical protein QUC31_002160 [Theobroma cacao]
MLAELARGMMSMMKQLEIPSFGSHHLGIDDTINIARVLQHMLADGAVMQITARRYPESQKVEFHFENRVRYPQRAKGSFKLNLNFSTQCLFVNHDYATNSYLNSQLLTFDSIFSIQMMFSFLDALVNNFLGEGLSTP